MACSLTGIKEEPNLCGDEDGPTSVVALSNGIITESMIKEEEMVLKEVEETTQKNVEKSAMQNGQEEEKQLTKEERYELLLSLLSHSKFYTQYIQKKISDGVEINGCDEKKAMKKDSKAVKKENTKSPLPSLRGRSAKRSFEPEESASPKRVKLAEKSNSDVTKQPTLLSGGSLRQYQLDGFHWLRVLYENGVNGILGDEMGLGKTIQCISLVAHLIEMNVPGPFLISAPLSTLPNWMAEFQKFTPQIPTILYHGNIDERKILLRQVKKLQSAGDFAAYPIVITSYEIVIRDHAALSHFKWKYIIVDEGHRIKNMKCLLIRRLKSLPSTNRLLLTGTPLQNNLSELWSLLNFILPEIFDNLQVFESWFDVTSMSEEGSDERIVALEQENHIISMLHEILAPFLLRRVKSDVEIFIPPKRELLVYTPLVEKQQVLYRAILDKTIEMVLKIKKPEVPPEVTGKRRKKTAQIECPAYKLPQTESVVNVSVRNNMMQLRKCCNHPYLLEYPLDPSGDYKIDKELIAASGKLLIFEALVDKLIEKRHKILVFSQMTKMLDILIDFCYLKKYRFSRLDGSMKLSERQESITQFNEDPMSFLFLLSTRAGGLGLNLTAADTVIIYDSDWNPQCDLQAMDRCHRIGQTKPVVVYRLVTANTMDQRIVDRAAAKRKLEKMIIQKGKFNTMRKETEHANGLSNINPTELLQLLKHHDHDGVIGSSSHGGRMFSNEEWKVLLDRNFSAEGRSSSTNNRVKVVQHK